MLRIFHKIRSFKRPADSSRGTEYMERLEDMSEPQQQALLKILVDRIKETLTEMGFEVPQFVLLHFNDQRGAVHPPLEPLRHERSYVCGPVAQVACKNRVDSIGTGAMNRVDSSNGIVAGDGAERPDIAYCATARQRSRCRRHRVYQPDTTNIGSGAVEAEGQVEEAHRPGRTEDKEERKKKVMSEQDESLPELWCKAFSGLAVSSELLARKDTLFRGIGPRGSPEERAVAENINQDDLPGSMKEYAELLFAFEKRAKEEGVDLIDFVRELSERTDPWRLPCMLKLRHKVRTLEKEMWRSVAEEHCQQIAFAYENYLGTEETGEYRERPPARPSRRRRRRRGSGRGDEA